MDIYLLDGTYELFRHFFGVPSQRDGEGREVGAVRGVLASVIGMFEDGVTHLGVATDHVVESFRNDLWPGYKTGEGIEPPLREPFALLEEGLAARGRGVWPLVESAAAAAPVSSDSRSSRLVRVNSSMGWRYGTPSEGSWLSQWS